MDAIALSCEKCGAALMAAEGVRFLTCGFCRSRLEIVRSPDSLRTKVLEEMEKTNAALARELEATRIRLAISDLDRDWSVERETLLVQGGNGGRFRPRRVGGILVAVFGVGHGVLWFHLASGIMARRQPGTDGRVDLFHYFPYFGILTAAACLGVACFLFVRAAAYDRALARYEAARADLNARLRALAMP